MSTASSWYMNLEISEQPAMLEDKAADWMAAAEGFVPKIMARDNLVVLGRGSSGNACVYASYLYGLRTGRHVISFRPWLSTQELPTSDWSDAAVLAFSVSGQSTDIAQSAGWLAERGAHVIGVTNAPDNDCRLGDAADGLFHLEIGEERAVPATKSFCAQLFAGAALLGYDIGAPARQAASAIRTLDGSGYGEQLADFMADAKTVSWVGRGPSLAACEDAALKLRETARQDSGGWSSAEIQHGFVGSLGPDDRAVIFSDGNDTAANITAVANALLSRDTPFIVAGADYHTAGGARTSSMLPMDLPEARWARAPVFANLSQRAALHLALQRGLDPDCPAGLKKVTETV